MIIILLSGKLEAQTCTFSVPAAESGGVSFGNVVAGQTYNYQASGCVPIQVGVGAQSADPDGLLYTDSCTVFTTAAGLAPSGAPCPGLNSVSLVGKVGVNCIQLGKSGSFIAPASGLLVLYCNDHIFGDNSGSWSVCITPAQQVCGTVQGAVAGGVSFGNVVAGQTYQYQASGCVGVNVGCGGPCDTADPDGYTYQNGSCSGTAFPPLPTEPDALCPSLIRFSLVGRVNGTCVQLGKNGSFVAPSSGQLVLYFNDNIYSDNSGSWNVCITPVPPPQQVCASVPAAESGGVSFGNVVAGQTYQYQASGCGAYQTGPGAHSSDPDGNNYINNCGAFVVGPITYTNTDFICSGLVGFSLVGKIGSACIQLGKNGSFVAPASGTLALYFNDQVGSFDDNSGSWNVCITPVQQVCGTVPAAASDGVSFGNVLAGQTYQYQASGCVGLNFPGNAYGDPDGNESANSSCSGPTHTFVADGSFTCPGVIAHRLVGKVGGTCITLGSSGSFTAPASGQLVLYCNDNIFGDNSSSWNVCITPGQSPCLGTCPTNLTVFTGSSATDCGAMVNYPATSTSGTCGLVSCSPPSGSFLPVGTTSVSCSVAKGLVAYYPFNGNANDASGNGNNGTVVGATFQTNGPNGTVALKFAGNSSSYVVVPESASLEPSTDLSIAMWVNGVPGDACGFGWGTILRKADNCQPGYLIRGCNGGTGFELDGPNVCFGGPRATAGFLTFTGTNWQHIVATYSVSDGMVKTYENGVLINQTPYANPLSHSGSLYIGGAAVAGDDGGFNGSINDVRIYNRALSATDIQELYNFVTNDPSCSFTVTVVDRTPPVLSGCPADITSECGAVSAPATVTATDNCDPSPTVTFSETIRQPCSQPNKFSFETGNLQGWQVVLPATGDGGFAGAVTSYAAQPSGTPVYHAVDGTYYALLKTDGPGSYTTLSRSFSASVGDKITGYAFFDAADYLPFNDNAQVEILSGSTVVATVFSASVSTVGNYGQTPWTLWTYTVTSPGTYTVRARITNVGDSAVDSYMGLDNVQLPCSCTPTIERTWTAIDASGNSSICTQTITLVDTTPPTIQCPANITTPTAPGLCSQAVTYTPTATDNCSGTVTTGCNPPSGSTFSKGTTPVTCVATDACGNTASCTFTVTVVDNEPPSIICPAPVTVNTDAGKCSASGVVLGSATAADNCSSNVTVINNAPTQFPLGDNAVVWTATDASGNTGSCTQLVTVVDNQPPTITCPPDITTAVDGAECSLAMLNVGTATATDNCTPTVGSARSDGKGLSDPYPVGTTLITWTATDSAGNTTNCVQQVTVLNAKSITANFNGTGIAKDRYLWFTAVASPVGALPTNTDFTVRFINPSVQFTAGGSNYNLTVPNGNLEFSASVSNNATTSFNGAEWVTVVPRHPSGNVLLTALAYKVPGGLPGGIHNVTFSGTFLSSVPGLQLNWKWAAAVYTSFSSSYGALGVKPTDQSTMQYLNSDHAGTPEQYKAAVTGGATGGGGANYTGSLSGTLAVTPCLEASELPSAMPEFRILSIRLEGNDVRVTWTAPGGCTNALQVLNGALTGCATNGFCDMPGPMTFMAGSGVVTNSCADVGGATNRPARFYRVRLVP